MLVSVSMDDGFSGGVCMLYGCSNQYRTKVAFASTVNLYFIAVNYTVESTDVTKMCKPRPRWLCSANTDSVHCSSNRA